MLLCLLWNLNPCVVLIISKWLLFYCLATGFRCPAFVQRETPGVLKIVLFRSWSLQSKQRLGKKMIGEHWAWWVQKTVILFLLLHKLKKQACVKMQERNSGVLLVQHQHRRPRRTPTTALKMHCWRLPFSTTACCWPQRWLYQNSFWDFLHPPDCTYRRVPFHRLKLWLQQ